MDRPRPKSLDSIPKIFGGMMSSRSIDEALGLPPPRPIDTSRNGYVMHYDLLDPSHLNGLASMIAMTSSMRTSLDMCKPVKEFPPASGSTLKSLFLDKPLTVSTLLHSLGFGKYAIHFQSEEVDIVTLKQMGDHDLKELGTPMVLSLLLKAYKKLSFLFSSIMIDVCCVQSAPCSIVL